MKVANPEACGSFCLVSDLKPLMIQEVKVKVWEVQMGVFCTLPDLKNIEWK